jgi:ureidoglycolate hydrolase
MATEDGKLQPIKLTGPDDSRFAPFGNCFSLDPSEGRIPVPLGGEALISAGSSTLTIITAPAVDQQRDLSQIERHPFSVQAFLPLGTRPVVTIVAPAGERPSRREQFTAFIVPPRHGIAYHIGTWHTGLMGLNGDEPAATFVRRLEDGSDTELIDLAFKLNLAEQI